MKKKKTKACDDEPEVFIGFGSVHNLSKQERKKPKHPIGFVHFPEKPAKKMKARGRKK